jgi:hypothetical protein
LNLTTPGQSALGLNGNSDKSLLFSLSSIASLRRDSPNHVAKNSNLVARTGDRHCTTKIRSNQPNWHQPAKCMAGIAWRAMKAHTNQIRSLQIESTGDFFLGKIKPRIRLTGYWLKRAGFNPGCRVEVRCEELGTITLRQIQQPKDVEA